MKGPDDDPTTRSLRVFSFVVTYLVLIPTAAVSASILSIGQSTFPTLPEQIFSWQVSKD